jgi:hypothetical protein
VEGLDLGEHLGVAGPPGQGRVVEPVDVAAGEQVLGLEPDGRGDLAGGQPVVAGDQTDRDVEAGQAADGLGGARLGGSRKASSPRSVIRVSSAVPAREVRSSGRLASASTR